MVLLLVKSETNNKPIEQRIQAKRIPLPTYLGLNYSDKMVTVEQEVRKLKCMLNVDETKSSNA